MSDSFFLKEHIERACVWRHMPFLNPLSHCFFGGGLKHPLGCLELFYTRVRFKIFNFYVANVQSIFERKCFFNKKFVPKNVKFGTKA